MGKAPKTVREVELETLVERIATENPELSNKGHSLSYLCLKLLKRAEDDQIVESITDGGQDLGVDLLFIEEGEERASAIIVNTRWFTKPTKLDEPFPHQEPDKLLRFFGHLRDDQVNLGATCNERLEAKLLQLKKVMSAKITNLEVWFVSNAQLPQRDQMTAFDNTMEKLGVRVRQLHREQIIQLMVSDSLSGPRRHLKVSKDSSAKIEHSDLKGIIGLVSVRELCKLMESPLFPNEPDPSLFAKNIRSFLGLGGDVNKEILRSLRRNHAANFWAKNNGLTMVARVCDATNIGITGLIELRGLSILNGAQTCSALFRQYQASKDSGESLDDTFVVFKLIETDDDDFIYQLTLTTNTQNRIRPRDIMANHHYQIELEKALGEHGVKYLRRSGELALQGVIPTLSSTLAGQLILASVKQEPHRAKTETDSIFGSLYEDLFRNPDVARLIWALKIFRMSNFIGEQIRRELLPIQADVSTQFAAYAHFHVVTVAHNLRKLGNDSDDELLVVSAFQHIATHLAQRRTSFYEYFRSPKRNSELLARFEQFDLFEDL